MRVHKVLLSSCGKIEPSSILPAAVLNDENYSLFSKIFSKIQLSAVFLKIFSRKIQNKNHRSQRKKRMRHYYQAKMLQEIVPLLI